MQHPHSAADSVSKLSAQPSMQQDWPQPCLHTLRHRTQPVQNGVTGAPRRLQHSTCYSVSHATGLLQQYNEAAPCAETARPPSTPHRLSWQHLQM